ncbi:MAG: hypothetical protein RIS94_3711, partial [Pseudomonadota bacterium]
QLVARRKDGSQFFAGVTIGSIDRHRQLLARHVVAVHDMSAEIERAKTAEANDAYHRAILDTVPDAMVTIDQDGLILWFSHTAEQLFGYRADEVIGRNVSMLMPDDEALLHDEYLDHYSRTGQKKVIGAVRRVYGRRKDGARFPHALFIGEANGGGRRVFTGFLRDLSQQEEAETQIRELQAELIHMSRVLAVGTMAGALAHELNQPLTAIANYVQTSAALLPETTGDLLDIMRDALDLAGQEALRAGAIIHRLREFVASGELERPFAGHRLQRTNCPGTASRSGGQNSDPAGASQPRAQCDGGDGGPRDPDHRGKAGRQHDPLQRRRYRAWPHAGPGRCGV